MLLLAERFLLFWGDDRGVFCDRNFKVFSMDQSFSSRGQKSYNIFFKNQKKTSRSIHCHHNLPIWCYMIFFFIFASIVRGPTRAWLSRYWVSRRVLVNWKVTALTPAAVRDILGWIPKIKKIATLYLMMPICHAARRALAASSEVLL